MFGRGGGNFYEGRKVSKLNPISRMIFGIRVYHSIIMFERAED
jgi:hypothetical protein